MLRKYCLEKEKNWDEGVPLSKFTGSYEILDRFSDTDYIIKTPDRRRKSRVCHVNTLKVYHPRDVATNTVQPRRTPKPAVQSSIEFVVTVLLMMGW